MLYFEVAKNPSAWLSLQGMDADSQLKRVPAVKPIKRLEEAAADFLGR